MTASGAGGPESHVWLPGVRGAGGIQRFSAHFVDALRSEWPGARHHVHLKNDSAPPHCLDRGNVEFYASGRVPRAVRTPVFAARIAAGAILRRPALLVVGHLHFGTVSARLPAFAARRQWVILYGIEAWGVEAPAPRRALARSDRIVAISHYTANRVAAEQDVDPRRFSALPCTFDPSRFRPVGYPTSLATRLGVREEEPVILTVARLAGPERRKGYDLVLDALPEIRRSIPDVHYVLVGDGPDRPRLEDRVREAGLGDAVTFAGFVPDEELVDYYNLCDLFAMPGSREGFGIVFLEAMGCGKAVIGGNADGTVDALQEGRLGILVDPEDPRAFADAAVAVLNGRHPLPILYEPDVLREKVVAEFGPAAFRARLRRLLEEEGLVGARRSSER